VAENHWKKIQTNLDPTIHSLLEEPWELWLDNEKISTEVNTDYSTILVDKLPKNIGPTKPNFKEWTLSPLTGQPYTQW